MDDVTGYFCEIELVWRQTTPEEWLAVLTDRRTGQRQEAHSEGELRAALESLVSGAAADRVDESSSAGDPRNGGGREP